jgi:hypothetical protein
MKSLKVAAISSVGFLMTAQSVLAGGDPNGVVPEIDGSGAVIAIGLVAGLVALVREKFFRK